MPDITAHVGPAVRPETPPMPTLYTFAARHPNADSSDPWYVHPALASRDDRDDENGAPRRIGRRAMTDIERLRTWLTFDPLPDPAIYFQEGLARDIADIIVARTRPSPAAEAARRLVEEIVAIVKEAK